MRNPNRCVLEFNQSTKNRKRIVESAAFVFVSCPDFSHTDGKYDFKSIRDGLPLTFLLAVQQLQHLAKEKPVRVYISDHEADRPEVQHQLKMPREQILTLVRNSLREIQRHFPNAALLSSLYEYEQVCGARNEVAGDNAERYAQVTTLFRVCRSEGLCPVLLYQNPIFLLVSAIRKVIPIPVLFLDTQDPH